MTRTAVICFGAAVDPASVRAALAPLDVEATPVDVRAPRVTATGLGTCFALSAERSLALSALGGLRRQGRVAQELHMFAQDLLGRGERDQAAYDVDALVEEHRGRIDRLVDLAQGWRSAVTSLSDRSSPVALFAHVGSAPIDVELVEFSDVRHVAIGDVDAATFLRFENEVLYVFGATSR